MTELENNDQRTVLIWEEKTSLATGSSHATAGYSQHASVEEKTLLLRKNDLECQEVSVPYPPHWCTFSSVSVRYVFIFQSP